MTGTKLWRLSLAAILGLGWLFLVPSNAYATCVNYIQSQTIAAAYEGDTEPVVHTMDTCGGDDISYQIPIATTITFDGVQYSNVYATTNSVITFGQPDGTYWAYPNTPSISLYSMDWVSGYGVAQDTLNIIYSEGGFQIQLQAIPFGQWNASEASNINIIVAITNTGGISVAYSYQGPQYNNLRTGVRLHNGDIVSLESWGATQIQPGSTMPTLQADPVSGSVTSPSPSPISQEQQQIQVAETTQLANEISDLNNLIASINGDPSEEITPTPEPTLTPDSTLTEEPDVVVEPEIVTPEDPRFPDEQTQPDNPNPSPSSDTTNEENEDLSPSPEPSEEPLPQPEDTNQDLISEPDKSDYEDSVIPSNNNSISEKELKELNILISENDAKLLIKLIESDDNIKQAVEEFSKRSEDNLNAPMPYTIADAITEVQAEKFLENPIAAFVNINPEVLLSPSEWGKDMTDDQREKAQEVIVPVIIASNIVAAAMTRRTK